MNFKQFSTSDNQWYDVPYYQHKTATDTLTLPAVIYPNDTSITVGVKGNTVQNGTPTPQNPVDVVGVGKLETTGEHAGDYKIPISSAGQTTPIYLGEVETERRVKKLVFDGTENWSTGTLHIFNLEITTYLRNAKNKPFCTHYTGINPVEAVAQLSNGETAFLLSSSGNNRFYIRDDSITTVADFKSYLAQQYANGTPVCVWYVLATPETAVVNEPLRKIGDYADEVSGITIPTIAGANTLSIGTTLQPSEVSVNYHGWHPVSAVHERENGQWD